LDNVFDNNEHRLTINEFMSMLNEHHEGFSAKEVQVLFQVVDNDRSGQIDKTELLHYATKGGDIDIENLYKQRKKFKKKKENAKKGIKLLGTWLNKMKIIIGYTQCMTFLRVTFSDIPWPRMFIQTMKNLEFTTFDIYALFGRMSCQMHR